jgi:hypothetical protein
MADIELVRSSLLGCLIQALPKDTPEGNPSILDPNADSRLWAEATLPYKQRLADTLGPLALVYRKQYLSALESS